MLKKNHNSFELFNQLFEHDYFYDEQWLQLEKNNRVITDIDNINDYVAACKQHIKASRIDLKFDEQEKIIEANSPFIETPDGQAFSQQSHYEVGVLLIHGSVCSPQSARGVADYCRQQGALVFAPLLPGAGTTPVNQDSVNADDFNRHIHQAIQSFAKHVDKIICVGVSMGGLLGVLNIAASDKIKGLVLITPALRLPLFTAAAYHFQHIIQHTLLRKRFDCKIPFVHPVRYLTSSFHINHQLYLLSRGVNPAATELQKIPLCIVTCYEDEYQNNPFLESIINANQSSKTRLLIYRNDIDKESRKQRVTMRNSACQKLNVMGGSHLNLFYRPDDPFHGVDNPYPLYVHYGFELTPTLVRKPWRIGAASRTNIKKYFLQRATFNPDFDYMARYIGNFIDDVLAL